MRKNYFTTFVQKQIRYPFLYFVKVNAEKKKRRALQ